MKRAVGYLSASADEIRGHADDLADQERQVRALAALWGLALVDVVIDRRISSGTPFRRRHGGARVLERLAAGGVTVVVAARLDRMFSTLHDAVTTLQGWTAREIALCLADVGGAAFLSASARGGDVLAVLTSAVALDRRARRERTLAAQQAQRAAGKYVGGEVQFGWFLRGGKLVPHPGEQGIIRRVKRARATGSSLRRIACLLNRDGLPTRGGGEWNHVQVGRILDGLAARRNVALLQEQGEERSP